MFLMRERKRIDLDGRGDGVEMGELKEEETVIDTYYVEEKTFPIKEKEVMHLNSIQ